MALGLRLTQQQKLILTQQMKTSLNILQMPIQQLKEYIEKEVENNVVIEIEEIANYLQGQNNLYHEYNHYKEEEISPFLFISEEKNFQDYLMTQIIEQVQETQMQEICFYMIHELDKNGFLTASIDDMAQALDVSKKEVAQALELIQGLDPVGVGTQNIKQCLQLQVLDKNPKGQSMILILIDNYLEYIATHRYEKIAEELNVALSTIYEYVDFIKSLEPKPTRGFYTGEMIPYIIPDAFIKKVDGKYEIIVNDQYLPRLFIQPTYIKLLNKDLNKEAGEYIQKHIQSALSLMKNIEDRKGTLHSVIEAILHFQEDYFSGTSNYVKPMTLRDIAQMIDMHESTVSRTVQDKYIDMEKRIVRIKDLFAQGISQNSTGEISVEEIKDIMATIIDQEDKTKPFSDQDICEQLQGQNIELSRRTVAKYRQSMEIPSSTQRKRK